MSCWRSHSIADCLVGDRDLELQHLADTECASCRTRRPGPAGTTCRRAPGTAAEPGVELSGGQGHGHAALDVEGDHAVEEQVVLALRDDLRLAVAGDEHRKLLQVGADEVPGALLGPAGRSRSAAPGPVGLVGGDDQVLLDRGAGDLAVGALLLVQGADVGDDEARRQHAPPGSRSTPRSWSCGRPPSSSGRA